MGMIRKKAGQLGLVREEASAEKTGLPVGAKAPDFELMGSDGQRHSLNELIAGGPLALVFFRSADW